MFFCSTFGFGQSPMYYTVGENELNDVDVYSLLEDHNGSLFISSDNGLYRYQNGTFYHYPFNAEQKSNSLFFLVQASDKSVFCSNLKGQIFKVAKNEIQLFYTIPKSELNYLPRILTDKSGHIVVVAKKITVLNLRGEVVEKIENFSFAESTINQEIIIGIDSNQCYFLHDKIIRPFPVINLAQEPIQQVVRKIYSKKLNTVSVNNNSKEMSGNPLYSVNHLKGNTFFVRLSKGGIKKLMFENNSVKEGRTLYGNIFISAFHSGKHNVYLGTFKQGIRIVSNFNISQLNHSFPRRSIKDFNVGNRYIYLNQRKEGLFVYDLKQKKYTYVHPHLNTKVLYAPNVRLNKSKYPSVLFDYKNIYAIKDIATVDSNSILLASNEGVFLFSENRKKMFGKWIPSNFKEDYYKLPTINERCISIAFDSINQQIFVGTQTRLLAISKEKTFEIKFNSTPIVANSLVLKNNQLYIASEKNGVLLYENNTVRPIFNTQNGLSNNSVRKIELYNGLLFVLNRDFFQFIDIQTGEIVPINKPEGIMGYVNNFHINNNELWVLTDNSNLISIPINQLKHNNSKLEFQVDSILVNNKLTKSSDQLNLSYFEDNLSVYTNIKNDAYREHTKIIYQLIGYDTEKNTLSPTTSVINYKKIPAGKYELSITAKYGSSKVHFSQPIVINAPFWRQIWFLLLCIFLVFAMIVLFYRYKLKQHKIKTQKRMLEQQISKDLTEAKLTALRSQMNPHFIFNALNSIQNLILKKDVHTSYDYIVLFSKLVRNTLNYSEKESVSIEEEVSFLDIYLQLEKLRFGKEFSYSIKTNRIERIEVPSLLIQPFVENALLHGLLNKKGGKHLSIEFETNQNQLLCYVVDNGVGRRKAKEIRKRQGGKHQSFALNAIEKRLSIMREKFGAEIGYSIIDLEENNIAIGTKVLIVLPFKEE